MFQELNEQIVSVKEELKRKKKLTMQLQDYQSELSGVENNINRLSSQLTEEQSDVEKLEGVSLTNFFSTLAGTKYEKLKKENKEVLAVELQLEESENTRDEIKSSILDLQDKLGKLDSSEKTYNDLLAKKEQLIKETDNSYANELYDLSEKEGDLQAEIKEINEAINAGKRAESALRNAEESLNSAANWGTLDMMGGGMITGAVKHSKIDNASNEIHYAQSRMREFQKELLDINEMVHVDMDISGLLKFADFFFDGLIVDWMVQGKINDSLNQVQDNLSKVSSILRKLDDGLSNSERKLSIIKQERKSLVESFS
ncbi:hypothetical protein E3U55_08080 [Filobacillus milosensis]|uniref:Uncharacterized protein n=1 Tax=Filobacillus milosensis TaxID=94137 RepID=A0A4Y8IKW1_9BACI|nr:hypothetical protein [Filobacillus milosensis]TFB21776.1 hypothetical protein E3U55_08080 [Filobacillus milosensis]